MLGAGVLCRFVHAGHQAMQAAGSARQGGFDAVICRKLHRSNRSGGLPMAQRAKTTARAPMDVPGAALVARMSEFPEQPRDDLGVFPDREPAARERW
jgi:hypothetical protein